MLQVRDLTVEFCSDSGSRIPAVRGASFDIGAGEVVGLLGESGSGKSSTALALLRLLPEGGSVVGGSVRFRGRELLTLDEPQLEKVRGAEISSISQEPGIALNPVRRVGDQVADVIQAHQGLSRGRCRELAEQMLTQVRLTDTRRFYAAYAHELSGGQRQRVVIAQALACRPPLVIADEPTAALDATTQAEILALLQDLRKQMGIALLLITHNPAILAGFADRILVMYAGRIVEEGRPAQVFRNPLHPYTAGLLRSIPGLPVENASAQERRLPSIAGSPPDLAHLPAGCPFEPRCADRMTLCSTREPEEVQPESTRHVRCFKYGG
ncbi:MAG: ABC transporter ATP-binding protein [Acidobacteria bacterium]|nr:ABC transporter ATP-binding protein [Acidobacteriota bacterium]